MSKVAEPKLHALKIPPHSLEAEQAVLGSVLLNNDVWDKVVDSLNESDFYRIDHRLIFHAMRELMDRSKPIDTVTLTEALSAHKTWDKVQGELYLFELFNNTPTSANVIAYAQIIRERSVLRQLIQVSGDIAENAYNPSGRESFSLLDDAERKVFEIGNQHGGRGSGPVELKDYLSKAVDKVDALYHSDSALTGISTGFTDLDNLTSGLQKGDLIILAARPSMGKTSLALNIAEHAAIKQTPVLVFSMEMPGESLALRMLSSLGRIDQHHVRTGKINDDDWPRITSAVSMLSEAKMYIDETGSLTPTELRARARRVAKEHGGLGLIVIDYLQLMQVPSIVNNRVAEISEISRSLKALAKELNVPVIALSQLNRSLEQRPDKRPVMSDLRESGAIEQDADLIAFIYRDEVYHPETESKGIAELIIAKHRNGPIGKINLTFLGRYTRFENHLSDEYSVGGFE